MITANSCRCAKCNKLMSFEERIHIRDFEFIPDTQCHGSRNRTVKAFNLCRPCYKNYIDFISNFFK